MTWRAAKFGDESELPLTAFSAARVVELRVHLHLCLDLFQGSR